MCLCEEGPLGGTAEAEESIIQVEASKNDLGMSTFGDCWKEVRGWEKSL